MTPELERYFPTPLRERFRDGIRTHRLRREILSSTLANRIVNRFGSTFVFRLQEELGASAPAVARASAVAWEVLDLRGLWSQTAALDSTFPEALRLDILQRGGRLAARTCRRLLQEYGERISVTALVKRYREPVATLVERLPALMDERHRFALEQEAAPFEEAGAPAPLARRAASLGALASALDLVEVAEAERASITEAAEVYFQLGADLDLDWLGQRLAVLPSQDRWHASARAIFRDELQLQHRALCAAVLRGATRTTSPAAKLEAWRRRNQVAVERYRHLIADLRALDDVDVAMLSVALRDARRLAEEAGSAQG